MEEREKELREISKYSYDLGRKLFELKVAYEIERKPEKRETLKKFIDETTKELKKALFKKALLKQNKEKEGKKK